MEENGTLDPNVAGGQDQLQDQNTQGQDAAAVNASQGGEWYREFGEFNDPESFKGHYKTLQEKQEQYEAKLKELESKTVSYSSDAIAQMDAYVRKLAAEDGITDAKEIERRVLAKMQEVTTDYIDLAKSNPASIIERSVREKYASLGASDADIARAIKKETMLPPKPSLEDYADEKDPEYIERLEAYQDAEADLRLKAMGIAKELEGKREKIDFQPKGYKTKEQEEQEMSAYKKSISDAAEAFKTGFKGFKAGDGIIEIPKERFEALWGEFSKPGGLADKTYESIMDPSNPAGFSELAELVMLREELPNIIAKVKEKAESDALAKHKSGLRQGGGDSPEVGGNSDINGEEFKRAARDYRPV